MTAEMPIESQAQAANPAAENIVQLRKLFEKEKAEKERLSAEKDDLQRQLMERSLPPQDDDEDDEPYVDKKRLKKSMAQLREEASKDSQTVVQREVKKALDEERKQNWMKNNPDFYDVMQHAQKLYEKDPELAETILEMPEGFERQKLVYKNVKALNLHKKPEPEQSIQSKIDQNRKSPYYQPSGIGTAPYANAGDYSPIGQKSAYDKMQELKNRLRLG